MMVYPQLEEWDNSKGAKTARIGSALYPGLAISMFNHSCAPNAVTVNVGGAGAIVVATRIIPKSAEVCVSYSVTFQACHILAIYLRMHRSFKFNSFNGVLVCYLH